MSSKKTEKKEKINKSKTPAKGKDKQVIDEPEPWINELKNLTINDENWMCTVNLLVDESVDTMPYVKAVNNMFITGQNIRPYIKILSDYSLAVDTVEKSYEVNQTLSPGYKKLIEEILKYSTPEGFSEDTPVTLLASLIKYYIYNLKLKSLAEDQLIEEYKQRLNKRREESVINIQNIMKGMTATTKDKSSGKSTKDNKATKDTKSASSKKSGKEKIPNNKLTTIRKRDEEILDSVFTEYDRPEDGPRLYIILNSFVNSDLPLELLKLQVPLVAVVKLHKFCIPDDNEFINDKDNNKICIGLNVLCKEATLRQRKFSNPGEELLLLQSICEAYWEKFYKILYDNNNISIFKDTMFLKFYPKLYELNELNSSKTVVDEVYSKIQKSIYTQLCHLLYDIQDVKRQHQNYINHLIDVNVIGKDYTDMNKMTVYASTVQSIPPELINIPFILDCMLLQVEHLVESKEVTQDKSDLLDEEVRNNENLKLENTLETELENLDIKHDIISQENTINEPEVEQLPLVLIYGDEIGIKTFWWAAINHIKNINCDILLSFWEKIFNRRLPVYDEIISNDELQNVDLFVMLKNTGDITVRDRMCNMPCLFSDTSITVKDKALEFCTNDETLSPRPSTECHIYRCGDLEPNNYPHHEDPKRGHFLGEVYDKHSYCFEEMTPDIILQNLYNSLETFNCYDLFQDYFKNRICIKFHHRKTCVNEEHLMGTIKTKTALRDFYDYTIDEEFCWLNDQELIYDRIAYKKELKRLGTAFFKLEYLKNRVSYMTGKICKESNFSLPNSLKRGDQKSMQLDSIPSYSEEEPEFRTSIYEEAPHLQSFEIDLPHRIQFSESRREFIISKNSILRVKQLTRLYKDKTILINATIHGHALYFYQPFLSEVTRNFHIIHQSGIFIHIKKNRRNSGNTDQKQSNEHGVRKSNNIVMDGMPNSEFLNKSDSNDIFLKPLMYEMQLSLPSTLYLEVINPININLYIKQHYLVRDFLPLNIREEKFRCYLTNGNFFKSMDDGLITIYRPNGEIIKCETSLSIPQRENSLKVIPELSKQPSATQKIQDKQKRTEKIEDVKPEIPQPLPEIVIKSSEHTLPTGERYIVSNGQVTQLEPLFCRSFNDLFNGIYITERADGTVLTYNKEGTLFTDFPDGSRITTTAEFDKNVITLDMSEEVEEEIGDILERCSKTELNFDQEDVFHEYEYNDEGNSDFSFFQPSSEDYVMINIQHYFEHLNYASVFINLNKEEIQINLPENNNIHLSSEGLYTINFDNNAQFITDYNKVLFREMNEKNLPLFTIHLSDAPENAGKKYSAPQTQSVSAVKAVSNNETTTTTEDILHKESIKTKQALSTSKTGKQKGSIKSFQGKLVEGVTNDKHYSVSSNKEDKKITESEMYPIIFSCDDSHGNKLTINNRGRVETNTSNGVSNICKCNAEKFERFFILNEEYNGLEVFHPDVLESVKNEATKYENCVVQNYGSYDHNVLLLLLPLVQNERDKWLMTPKKIEYCPMYTLPSTYNTGRTTYNPFPKTKELMKKCASPNVLVTRVINRVNCNIHLMKETFLQNKQVTESLRLEQNGELALRLYVRGDIPLCKADKAFIEYIKDAIIGTLIGRVRRRVVKRLEMRKIREYTDILVKRLLLPYFDSAQGATFVILLDLILITVQVCEEGKNRLEKLFLKPLQHLRDDDLDYMHDRIAPLTVSRFCNCDEDRDFCKLRILLLAGKTLHGIFPDMITVFHSYGRNLKKKKEHERLVTELRILLCKPTHLLTEDDLISLHDDLRELPCIPFCSCNIDQQCRLKAMLMACVTLSFIFPNVYSVFKTYKVENYL